MTAVLFKQPAGRHRPPRAEHLGAYKFLSVGKSHPGCVRTLNEDAFLNRPDVSLWAVADGMGGHESGEVASAMVVDALAGVSAFSSAYSFRNGVSMALQDANMRLQQKAASEGRGTIGSTVVALLVHHGYYACLWAGDSRAYLQRNGEFIPITRDHTFVQGLVDSGALSASEQQGHAKSHVITRAVGAAPALKLDSAHGPVRAGDRFVLCSDGLTGMLSDADIARTLARPPLEGALDRLIDAALVRGAPDNVTAVLIGVEAA